MRSRTKNRSVKRRRRNASSEDAILKALERDYDRIGERLEALEHRIGPLQEGIDEAGSEIAELKEQIKEAGEERRELEKQIREWVVIGNKLGSDLVKAQAKLSKLTTAINPLNKEYDRLEREQKELEQQIEALS